MVELTCKIDLYIYGYVNKTDPYLYGIVDDWGWQRMMLWQPILDFKKFNLEKNQLHIKIKTKLIDKNNIIPLWSPDKKQILNSTNSNKSLIDLIP